MKQTIAYLLIGMIASMFASCIEDGFTAAPSDQPVFSVDTLDLGTIFTDELSTTSRFTVINPHSKGLNISDISISGPNAQLFRINVDGMSGNAFTDTEIRANDSIYVLVEAHLPENGVAAPQTYDASLDFITNGVKSSVVLSATGQDIKRLKGVTYSEDASLNASIPYQITDSLVVAEGATLTLEAGARLMFHDKAVMVVRGTLIAAGTPDAPVKIAGDRLGEVLPDISFDIMSRQWDGIYFTETSKGNRLEYCEVANTSTGVSVYGDWSEDTHLTLINSRLHNSGDCALQAYGANITALGTELAEASYALAYLVGGSHRLDQCTLSNNYLFTAVGSPALTLIDPAETEEFAQEAPLSLLMTNSIIYGIGDEMRVPTLEGRDIRFARCLFKSTGEDDENFVNCIYDADPLFYTVRSEYHFDYRLQPESPAIGAADPALSEQPLADDMYGVPRNGDLGAYAYVEPPEGEE